MTMEENKIMDENLIIVEDNPEGTLMTISSPKRKAKYIIYKPEDGYGMFKIKLETGDTADILSGYYTSRKTALQSLTFYLEHTKESKEAKWDRMFGDEKAPPLKKKEVKVASAD